MFEGRPERQTAVVAPDVFPITAKDVNYLVDTVRRGETMKERQMANAKPDRLVGGGAA